MKKIPFGVPIVSGQLASFLCTFCKKKGNNTFQEVERMSRCKAIGGNILGGMKLEAMGDSKKCAWVK